MTTRTARGAEWSPTSTTASCVLSNGLNVQMYLAVVYMHLCDTSLSGMPRMSTWLSAGLLVFSFGMIGVMSVSAAADLQQSRAKNTQPDAQQAAHGHKDEDKHKFAQAGRSLWKMARRATRRGCSRRWRGSRLVRLCCPAASSRRLYNRWRWQTSTRWSHGPEVAPAFHTFLRALVEQFGGEYSPGPNKTRARAIEKIEHDYGGDHTPCSWTRCARRPLQELRAAHARVAGLLEDGCELIVVRAKDRFNKPLGLSYRDMLLNVRLGGSEHVGEFSFI